MYFSLLESRQFQKKTAKEYKNYTLKRGLSLISLVVIGSREPQ